MVCVSCSWWSVVRVGVLILLSPTLYLGCLWSVSRQRLLFLVCLLESTLPLCNSFITGICGNDGGALVNPCSRHTPYFCSVIVTHVPLCAQGHFPQPAQPPLSVDFLVCKCGPWASGFLSTAHFLDT